jgi:hypothetical protein
MAVLEMHKSGELLPATTQLNKRIQTPCKITRELFAWGSGALTEGDYVPFIQPCSKVKTTCRGAAVALFLMERQISTNREDLTGRAQCQDDLNLSDQESFIGLAESSNSFCIFDNQQVWHEPDVAVNRNAPSAQYG